MALTHDTTEPRSALWGADHTTGTESEGDLLVYRSGEWQTAASNGGQVVMVSGVTPPDPVLNSAGDDWVYSSF